MKSAVSRNYSEEADCTAVRQFLIDTYAAHGWMFNWGPERWEIVRYSGNVASGLMGGRPWEGYVQLWEAEGRIVGVAHPEDGGDFFVEVDPDYRHLEDEMFAWGEANRSPARRPGGPFSTYVVDGDAFRVEVLERRGWSRGDVGGHLRRRSMVGSLPAASVRDRYVVRSLDLTTEQDSEGRAAVSRASFGTQRTGEMMKVLAQAPSYVPELDFAAIAEDGTFAAYTTVWWEPTNRYVIFEPVETHPEHRRRGLASAVMAEGLRCAAVLGAKTAYVGSGAGNPSNLLYDSLGFIEVFDYVRWDAPDNSG
jgi:predicted N-acetyltransferase YhbS